MINHGLRYLSSSEMIGDKEGIEAIILVFKKIILNELVKVATDSEIGTKEYYKILSDIKKFEKIGRFNH